ncbi:GTPase [Aquimarina sp. MMG016]|uniref:GTPase n=1 Tax=Aquimarina sp. MMG016 TaxID=2822690 RepID=UPI001B39D16E|nr:GTPase [Aquimarina sp. MMG016]MBQ4818437.1 GTPase [Aquimarina sp. MMG016]
MRALIFVYNAKSGFWNKSIDMVHKILSPSTYSCDLCSLTHGNFSENQIWKEFRENSNYDFAFIYKDEFLDKYQIPNLKLPVIFEKDEGDLKLLIDDEELSKLTSVESLISLVKQKTT